MLAIVAATVFAPLAFASAEQSEFFERAVRPILATHCYSCHGAEAQKSGLRLDHLSFMLAGGETGPALVPGDIAQSRMITAVRYGDVDFQMPPRAKLPDDAIAVLETWIAQGAFWPDEPVPGTQHSEAEFNLAERAASHWAWQPIQNSPVPAVQDPAWSRNDIDRFILARLEAETLRPAAAADPAALLRRTYFTLTGLPPSPDAVRTFLRDPSDAAYETVVDALLASPQFGETWARHWLDLTRYAETYGFEQDFPVAQAWRYRDYVIRAFNADVPYDRLVQEHIAGDLIAPRINPDTGLNESIIATGFWWMMQAQHAPVDVRQDHSERIDNQIDVFGKTFLAMTISCARCHDHKFDAISAADYFALSGVLRSTRYQVVPLDPGGSIKQAIEATSEPRSNAGDALFAWLGSLAQSAASAEPAHDTTNERVPPADATPFATFATNFDGWYVSGDAFGDAPTGARSWGVSDGKLRVQESGVVDSGLISPELHGVLRSPSFTLEHSAVHVRAAGRAAQVRLVIENYFIREHTDLLFEKTVLKVDHGDELRWLELSGGLEKYRGCRAHIEIADEQDGYIAVDEVRFANGPLVESATPAPPTPTLAEAVSSWNDGRAGSVDTAAINTAIQSNFALAQPELATTLQELQRSIDAIPAPVPVLAMADGNGFDIPVHVRGNYKTPGELVPRRFLEAIDSSRTPFGGPGSGRIELAKAMVAPNNTLTARVMVNRIWQHIFGKGIVATSDNFGVMGSAPSHPALLDYLATRFQHDGWSTKRLVREMVLTSTFRMASSASDGSAAVKDPNNILLHRMPLQRLEAEAIRDSVLASAGTLDSTLFGPSIPAYVSPFMGGHRKPEASGPMDGARRRSIYLEVRRNFLPALFLAFDFPVPDSTHGTRTVSNVPAQSLVLMNDPFVAAQASALGAEIAKSDLSPELRVAELYLRVFSREPDPNEMARAVDFLRQQAISYGVSSDAVFKDSRAWTDLIHALFMGKEFLYA